MPQDQRKKVARLSKEREYLGNSNHRCQPTLGLRVATAPIRYWIDITRQATLKECDIEESDRESPVNTAARSVSSLGGPSFNCRNIEPVRIVKSTYTNTCYNQTCKVMKFKYGTYIFWNLDVRILQFLIIINCGKQFFLLLWRKFDR